MATTLSATGAPGTRTGGRHLGLALLVIATAQLAWIRRQLFPTGFLRSFVSVALGGAIIAGVSATLGALG